MINRTLRQNPQGNFAVYYCTPMELLLTINSLVELPQSPTGKVREVGPGGEGRASAASRGVFLSRLTGRNYLCNKNRESQFHLASFL